METESRETILINLPVEEKKNNREGFRTEGKPLPHPLFLTLSCSFLPFFQW